MSHLEKSILPNTICHANNHNTKLYKINHNQETYTYHMSNTNQLQYYSMNGSCLIKSVVCMQRP